MARSIPDEPRWAPDTPPAEQILWRWAVGQLPDAILVLPQVAMTVPGRGRPQEAEADLVIVDPAAGVTVVEVKGGELHYSAHSRRWFQNGREAERDPVDQAKRARSILRRALDGRGVPTTTLAQRWAVATPDCRMQAPGAPVLDAARLWDAGVRDRFAEAYRRTIGQFGGGEEPLGGDRAGFVARVLRGREVSGQPALSTAVDEHEARVRVHTEGHRNVLHHITAHDNVLVYGAAGTGKTVLALEAATRFAAMGRRVLLACWNVVLGRWLRHQLRHRLTELDSPLANEVTATPTGRIVVGDVGTLARPDLDVAAEERPPRYFTEQLPDRLDLGATDGPFDVVVLDEAQDLSEMWVLAVAGLVARDGRWFAFADRHQDLFAQGAPLPDFLEVDHELTANFRNSRPIARFAARFGPLESDCLVPDGPPVRFVSTAADHVIDQTERETVRLRDDDNLGPDEIAGICLFHNPHQHHSDELAHRLLDGQPVLTNTAAFKGMERPAVVLGLDMDADKAHRAEEVARAIYAGATRARSHLTVVGDPDVAAAYGFEALSEQLEA